MPAVSQKQRAYMFAVKGEKFARKHHFDNKGPLPKYAPKRSRRSAGQEELVRRFQRRHGGKGSRSQR